MLHSTDNKRYILDYRRWLSTIGSMLATNYDNSIYHAPLQGVRRTPNE